MSSPFRSDRDAALERAARLGTYFGIAAVQPPEGPNDELLMLGEAGRIARGVPHP